MGLGFTVLQGLLAACGTRMSVLAMGNRKDGRVFASSAVLGTMVSLQG